MFSSQYYNLSSCLRLYKTNLSIQQEHHLGSDGHITEALLVPEVLEGGHHVGLEVIPPKTELLIVSHGVLITMTLRHNSEIFSFFSDNKCMNDVHEIHIMCIYISHYEKIWFVQKFNYNYPWCRPFRRPFRGQ